MASISEQGRAKNVANFESLIIFCKSYGTKYAPTNARLQITQLTTLLTNAQTKIQNLQTLKTVLNIATDERQKEFENLKKLTTKVINALSASGIAPKIIEDAKQINAKIQSPSPKSNNKENEVNTNEIDSKSNDKETISTSQQSYDKLTDNFSALIELLKQNATYNPNETELKTTALTTKLNALKTRNTNQKMAYTNYSNSIIERDKILYDPTTGIIQTAKEIKLYIKSIFGATAPEYKQIAGIEFKNN